MSFVVETGTGVANANAYIAVATADAYFADRGITTWVGDTTVKQGAIVRATDYIDMRFSSLFIGLKLTTAQALAWPRVDSTNPDFPVGVPVQVQRACAEYALRALSGTLAPDPETDSTGRAVIMKSNKIGPITETVQYVPQTGYTPFKPYPAADVLLRPLINSSRQVIRA